MISGNKRMDKGFRIYNNGLVTITLITDNLVQAKVVSESGDNTYLLDIDHDVGFCSCPDYMNRHDRTSGSFMCKHLYALMFAIGATQGMGFWTLYKA
jgi:predicted nucleic acid-binding Zn finger protein